MDRFARSLIGAVVLAVALALPASAAPPQRQDIPSVDFDDPFVCGGDPVIHVSYTTSFRLVTWTDKHGNVIRDATFAPRTRVVLTDVSTGRSLSGTSPAIFRTTFAPDGSVISLSATGLNAAITIPGQGVILLDTGKITWAGGFGGPITVESGPHQWQGTADRDAFCEYFD
jgi:hypothetical protein